MTSSSGVTGARDQSLESSQSDSSTKSIKLFWRVADKHREIFAGTATVASDLSKIK